ncbi:hypothetical protein [Frankia sp. AgB32]|uniref:hypothetical protein n=1 Tax=Frankia sp. AgB32 TaxID=631119 RepID=UPI00200CCEC1|nr:hypothetical protein [Frankia sp. AgB32]MCK9893935.1 hypothetical protein [Frankia sp. AgB32]
MTASRNTSDWLIPAAGRSAAELVAYGLGVAMVPPSLDTRGIAGLCLVPLAVPAPTFPTAIVTADGATPAAARILRDTVLTAQPARAAVQTTAEGARSAARVSA